MKTKKVLLLIIVPLIWLTCQERDTAQKENRTTEFSFTNPLLDNGAEPWAIFHNDRYYYTQGAEDKIILWQTTDITDLRNAEKK